MEVQHRDSIIELLTTFKDGLQNIESQNTTLTL